jgi:O-methyltransferase domain/Dimerisation domain
MIMGFLATHLLTVAAELGLADVLKDGRRTTEELAVLLGADASALYRVLRGLAQLGVLSREGNRFELTPLGQLLRSEVSGSLRSWARMWGSHFFQRAFLNLLHTVKTGEVSFDHTFGQDFFGYLAKHHEDAVIFDEAMAGGSARTADAILSKYDFSHLRTLVDVGGGNATFMTAILRANPDLRGIVVDLPHLEEQAQERLAAAGLAERGRFMAGNFFDALAEGADAYLLKLVLHSFNDTDCVSILRNCRRSMSPNGKVLVVDQIMPSGNEDPTPDQVALDLTMLVLRKGRERTESEFRSLFEQAGLQLVRTVPLLFGQHILEAAPR